MASDGYHRTLGVVSFGLAVGIASALFVLLLGTVAALFGWGLGIAAALSTLFIGFGPSFVGAIAGAVWAFAFGFLFGLVVAWCYNRLLLQRRGILD